MGMEFRGWDRLQRKLDAVANGISDKGMDRVVRAGARVFRDAVEEAAPVLDERTANSTALEPGALKADIRMGLRHNAVGTAEAHVGPGKDTARVARWVEYGHRLVKGGYSKVLAGGKTRGPGAEIGEVAAHPFIRPAYEASLSAAEEAMAAELDKVVKESANNG